MPLIKLLLFSLPNFCTSHFEFIPNVNIHAIVDELSSPFPLDFLCST